MALLEITETSNALWVRGVMGTVREVTETDLARSRTLLTETGGRSNSNQTTSVTGTATGNRAGACYACKVGDRKPVPQKQAKENVQKCIQCANGYADPEQTSMKHCTVNSETLFLPKATSFVAQIPAMRERK